MKKVMPLLGAFAIATAPFAVYVQAETPATTTVDTVNTQNTTPSDSSLAEVTSLTLEDVLKRGVENNTNLTVLQYRLEELEKQTQDATYDKSQLAWDIKDITRQYDNLRNERDRLSESAAISANFQVREGLLDTIDVLNDQLQVLELAIKNLQTGKIQLQLQKDEAVAGVTLMLTSSYTNLLLTQDQIKFTQQSISYAKTTLSRTERLYKLGMASKDSVRQATASLRTQQKQLNDLNKKFAYDFAKLCFDIGVKYTSEITLKALSAYTPAQIETPPTVTELVNSSYKVQKAEKDIQIAQNKLDDATREYNEKDYTGADVSSYELEQYAASLNAAKATLTLTKEQVTTSLNQLYHQADQAYASYEEATASLEDIKADTAALNKRYRLGLVSKYTYEAATVKLKQAEFTAATAKTQYYLITQQITAATKGYLQ